MLSASLEVMAACFGELEAGTIALTPEGVAAIGATLREAFRDARALELALDILGTQRVQDVDVALVQRAVASGTVLLLPTHRTLVALGYADVPESPALKPGGAP